MSNDLQHQRTMIRLQLQAQRQAFAGRLFRVQLLTGQAISGDDNDGFFPRSMLMRLLTRHNTLTFILIREVAPLLLRRFINKSGNTFHR